MPTERAILEAALDRLAAHLRVLADTLPSIDALEAYLDLARPLVDECVGRERLWVNARVEEIWSACPAVSRSRGGRSLQRIPVHPARGAQATAASMWDRSGFVRDAGFGIERR